MYHKKKALIVFARNPALGKVKTRLAATIGNEKALEIYLKLLSHTKEIIEKINCDKYIFLTDLRIDNFWNGFNVGLQNGNDLGKRMENAFKQLFDKGFEQVLIIGSDCPTLSAVQINEAFENLDTKDVVIGPATDGGYYLLGMNKLYTFLFEDKDWSTETVLKDTLINIEKNNLSHYLLQVLADVDEEKDIPVDWL